MEGIVVAAVLVILAVPIAGIIDAGRRPEAAFTQAGHSRTQWAAGQLVGLFLFGIVGFVLAVVYFTRVRPKLEAARSAPAGRSLALGSG